MIQIPQDTIDTLNNDPKQSTNDNADLLLFEILHPNAILPTRQTNESVSYDVTTIQDVTIMPQQRKFLRTGLKINSPVNHYARISPQSGLATKGIHVGTGVIDHDFHSEVGVLLFNLSNKPINFHTGQRVARVIFKTHFPHQTSVKAI